MTALPFPSPNATLSRYGLRPKKAFGQNFIKEPGVVERIARECSEVPARVLEIGAGLGALTFALLNQGHTVTAIERDRDLIPILQDLGREAIAEGRLRVLAEDAKAVDFEAVLNEMKGSLPDTPGVVMGNVPYNLTGILLRKATYASSTLERCVFLVQREVTDRLAASPGTEDYGALSVFAQAAFAVKPRFSVARAVFHPPPNVDSRVVVLDPLRPPRAEETDTFRLLVKAAFEQRRKTLRNAWREVQSVDRERLDACAKRAGILLDARGETLSVEEFRAMSEALSEGGL